MNEVKPRTAGSEAPDAEVELSAQDLLELSVPCDNSERAQAPVARTRIASIDASAPAPQTPAAPMAARSTSFLGFAASVSIAVGLVIASYFVMRAGENAARSMTQQQALRSQLPAAAIAAKGKGQPVLFANPFDANEVFEFPAGTSEAEAREEVAEILMARAMERQRRFDARVSSNR